MATRRGAVRRLSSVAILCAASLAPGCALGGSGDAGDARPDRSRPRQDPAAGNPAEVPHGFAFEDLGSNRPTGERIEGGEEAEFVAADGSVVRLSDFRGRPLVLVFNRGFVGYVCPYCATYTAQLAARHDEVVDLGARVLLVYPSEEDDPDVRRRFVDAVEGLLASDGAGALPFPVLLDPGLRATRRFNLLGDLTRPSTFVLDAWGVVRYAYVGQEPDERPAVDRILSELEALAQ